MAAHFAHGVPGRTATELDVLVPAELEAAVPRRRGEYLAGRWCARNAVRSLFPDFTGQIGRDGAAPAWPAGVVGSITHTGGFACAAVASPASVLGVGIDSETIGDAERIRAIRDGATASGEERDPKMDEALHYTLVFSAKESLFKCLFPAVRRMFWYEEARITPCPTTGTFRATLLVDLSAELCRGRSFDGTFRATDRLVHTAVVRRRA